MSPQKAEKRAKNELYALRFPRRKRKLRKKARQERVEARERAWLLAVGIARDERVPLA